MSTTPVNKRRAGRRAHRSSGLGARTRALMSLGAVAFLALGFGAQGTFAFWTDSATVTTGSFSSGTLDITLNGALAGAANNGGTTTLPSFALTDMVPGESQAVTVPVANQGSVGLTYTISGTATGTLAPAMQFSVFAGTANAQTGTAANGNRTGSCSGTALANNQTYSATAATVVGAANQRLLAAGASENICVVATLPGAVDNTFQGKTMTASLVFNSKQVGAP